MSAITKINIVIANLQFLKTVFFFFLKTDGMCLKIFLDV